MTKVFKTPFLVRWMFPRRVWGFSSSDAVFLTFDDGPTPELTTWILDTLREKGVKATFFCVGENALRYPELIEKIKREGHAIGNHTMRHEKGTKVKRDTYHESIREASEHISSELFRPPYGRLPKHYEKKIRDDYSIVMWSWLSYDFDKSVALDTIVERADKQIKAGDILVLHDNLKVEDRVKELLPKLIDLLHEKGLKFEAISV